MTEQCQRPLFFENLFGGNVVARFQTIAPFSAVDGDIQVHHRHVAAPLSGVSKVALVGEKILQRGEQKGAEAPALLPEIA